MPHEAPEPVDLAKLGVADFGRIRIGAGWRPAPSRPAPAAIFDPSVAAPPAER